MLTNWALFATTGEFAVQILEQQAEKPFVEAESNYVWIEYPNTNLAPTYDKNLQILHATKDADNHITWSIENAELPPRWVRGLYLHLAMATLSLPDGRIVLNVVEDFFASPVARNTPQIRYLSVLFANFDGWFSSTNEQLTSVCNQLGITTPTIKQAFEIALALQNNEG